MRRFTFTITLHHVRHGIPSRAISNSIIVSALTRPSITSARLRCISPRIGKRSEVSRGLNGRTGDQEKQRMTAQMETVRTYGSEPFRVVVIHGGPGALGSVAPIARQLGQRRGVLEPLQTATTLNGQVEELRRVVEQNATPPVTFIGHSWGAWLSALVTAAYPDLVRKLILVGSGPFEAQYVLSISENRFSRLTLQEQQEYLQLVEQLEQSTVPPSTVSLSRLGELSEKTDTYDPIEIPNDPIDLDNTANPAEIYKGVWPQAAHLR